MSSPPYRDEDLSRDDALRGRAVREGLAYWTQQQQKFRRHRDLAVEDWESLKVSVKDEGHLTDLHRIGRAQMRVERWTKELKDADEKLLHLRGLVRTVWE